MLKFLCLIIFDTTAGKLPTSAPNLFKINLDLGNACNLYANPYNYIKFKQLILFTSFATGKLSTNPIFYLNYQPPKI